MSVHVTITDGPLPEYQPGVAGGGGKGVGAVIVFDGVVRADEGDQVVQALDYEAYEPMASKMLGRIGVELVEEFGLISMVVEHSRGRVAVGACSFRLRIESAHRREGLEAMGRFIDLLKRDVPIWKSPVWAD